MNLVEKLSESPPRKSMSQTVIYLRKGKSDNLKRNTWDVHSGIYSAMRLSCNSQDNLGGASKAEQTCLTPKTFLLRMKKMQQSKENLII